MKMKLLIGMIAAIFILLIVAEILFGSGLLLLGVFNVYHVVIWIPLAVWIFFVWMVWKKKLLYDQMDSKLSKSSLIWLRIFLLLGGISYALWWNCILYWDAIFGKGTSEESPLPYIIGLLCAIGSIGFLVISVRYIIRRRKITKEIPK